MCRFVAILWPHPTQNMNIRNAFVNHQEHEDPCAQYNRITAIPGNPKDPKILILFHMWHLGSSKWMRDTPASGASIFQYSRKISGKSRLLSISVLYCDSIAIPLRFHCDSVATLYCDSIAIPNHCDSGITAIPNHCDSGITAIPNLRFRITAILQY